MEKRCVRSSDRIITAGHLLAQYWKEQTGKEVHFIPNGVDLNVFRVEEGEKKGTGATNLGYIGTLSAFWIDMDLILKSIHALLERGFNLRLIVAGEGRQQDDMESVRELIRKYDLFRHVDLLGALAHDKLPSVLKDCHIGLALSPENLLRRYAFPLKVIEYMAMGLPVIGNRDTETGRIIDYYQTGLSIDPTADAFSRALVRLIEDKPFAEKCRMNGLTGARDFDLNKLAVRRYEAIVKGLMT
jgi:glycosyltransferase involved in cell wall biosynthesis